MEPLCHSVVSICLSALLCVCLFSILVHVQKVKVIGFVVVVYMKIAISEDLGIRTSSNCL